MPNDTTIRPQRYAVFRMAPGGTADLVSVYPTQADAQERCRKEQEHHRFSRPAFQWSWHLVEDHVNAR